MKPICKALLLGVVLVFRTVRCQAVEGRRLERRHHLHPSWPSSGALPEASASVQAVAVINPFPW